MSSFSDIIETGKDVLGKDYAKKPVNINLNKGVDKKVA